MDPDAADRKVFIKVAEIGPISHPQNVSGQHPARTTKNLADLLGACATRYMSSLISSHLAISAVVDRVGQ